MIRERIKNFNRTKVASMTLSSFAQLAARLATADADMKLAREAILEKACR